MATLDSDPVQNTLRRLFQDCAGERALLGSKLAQLREEGVIGPDEEPHQWLMRIGRENNYNLFTGLFKDAYIAVEPQFGRMLCMMALACRASTIVEFGMSFGVSTIHLAAALRDLESSPPESKAKRVVITTEFAECKVARARANFEEAGLADLIEIRVGDALETLAGGLPDEVDLVLLDGAPHLYLPVLQLLESRLKPGAVVLADNGDLAQDFVEYVRHPSNGYMSFGLNLTKGNEFCVRVGGGRQQQA
jgi:protein-L-isoaspartate O-methyltransferase